MKRWRSVIGGVAADKKGTEEDRTYRATVSLNRETMRCGVEAVESYMEVGKASPEQRKARWFSLRDKYESIGDEDSAGEPVVVVIMKEGGMKEEGEVRTIEVDLKNRFYGELAGGELSAVVTMGPWLTKEVAWVGMRFPMELRFIEHRGMYSRATYSLEIPNAEAFPWEDRPVPCGHGNHYFVKWEREA